MKTIARIATATVAAIVSVFIASPAFAHDAPEKYNPADQFSTVNDPLQVGAILLCGAILLIIVLLLAQWIGSAFNKKA